ncbi:MAG TPA: type III-B CRISPR module-associated protein Cmr5 [Isosphaeraceae bacterium]|jgi:CRISPR-associated protein Cmr5
MSVHTRSQRLAQAAYARIDKGGKLVPEYVSFAKKFPALIHTCGLAQAVAFALAKKQSGYVEDLAAVLKASGHPEITSAQTLDDQTRTQQLSGYLRLSRDAIHAAGWLKRYVEAAGEEE